MVGDDVDDEVLYLGEFDNDIFGLVVLDFKEVGVVYEVVDDVVDIEWCFWVGRDEVVYVEIVIEC